jgi:hypothetical protein
LPKSLYEIHVSFLEPAEAVITASGNSEAEVEANLRATLDQVQELKIIAIKNLGPVPDETAIDTSAGQPVDPSKLN